MTDEQTAATLPKMAEDFRPASRRRWRAERWGAAPLDAAPERPGLSGLASDARNGFAGVTVFVCVNLPEPKSLTPLEREIIGLIAQGHSCKTDRPHGQQGSPGSRATHH
jgi:hypothetical protein